MQVRKLIHMLVAVLALATLGTLGHASPRASAQEASYVRICKSRRGVPDRRACHGKDDPQRTTLAQLIAGESQLTSRL